jgi:hypothetical protein
MGLLPGGDSGVSRLTINAHKLPDCSDKPNDKTGVFIVQVNPKQVEYSFGVNSPEDSASGNSAQPTGFTGYNKITMIFDFKADATGIVPVDSTIDEAEFENGGKPSIRGHLNKLQNVVYGYEPEIHGPPFLSFVWGNIFPDTSNAKNETGAVFKGKLSDCSVTITLFSTSGEPIKADIKLTIVSEVPADARPMGNSPDITHHVDVGYGDKMTMHCNEIYGRYDSKICAAVAEYNNLIDWDLKEGTHMVFPSIHILNERFLDNYEDVEIKSVHEENEYEQMLDLIGDKKTKQYYKIFNNKDGSFPQA